MYFFVTRRYDNTALAVSAQRSLKEWTKTPDLDYLMFLQTTIIKAKSCYIKSRKSHILAVALLPPEKVHKAVTTFYTKKKI